MSDLKTTRKNYLDNIRWAIVLLVVLYHVVYNFNSAGVPSTTGIKGIQQMDILLYFVYPWFMACLFLVAGISARYSLQKRNGKEFLEERVKKLLIPSTIGLLVLGWVSGYVAIKMNNSFGDNFNKIPGVIRYLIYSLSGTGPLWFAQELFLASVVLLIVRKLDKKDSIWKLSNKINIWGILLLFFAVWGSSQILNVPVITVYRNGIYIFIFLLGYYVFSHDEVLELLEKWHLPFLISAVVCGIAYTIHYYGTDYTSAKCLQSIFSNIYTWIMTLAILGCSKAWFNKTNRFTEYMSKSSFGIYVLHYPVLALSIYLLISNTKLPMLSYYIILFVIEVIAVPCVYEIVRRIPIVRFLALGISKHSNQKRVNNTEVIL